MLVEPNSFVVSMSRHWTETLGNVPSAALQAVWRQMAATFNRQIENHDRQDRELWQVLQPATGTGKSQGLAVYCSMLPREDHPGVLVVTRLKAQADELAATINRLSGADVAVPYHTDNRVPVAELAAALVLVITHKAYENGLDAICRGDPKASSWQRYHKWEGGDRRLVVIDEALDIVEEAQISVDQVRNLKGCIPFEVAQRFPHEMAVIERVEEVLVSLARREDAREEPSRERLVAEGEVNLPDRTDFTALRRALREYRFDHRLLRHSDPDHNRRILQGFDLVLRDIQSTLERWHWYAKKMNDHTLNTARLIIPEDVTGAVVLDATASSNLVYQLFEERVMLVPVPEQARSYRNVTLHVSMGHAVGKTSLGKDGKAEAGRLVENLHRELGQDRRVFVCTHRDVEPHLVALDTGFASFDVGHWGAIDGRNDWQQCDAAVIFGLPYRDKTWSANTYMAFRGPQSTEWLNSEGRRPFGPYPDIRHSLEVGQLVVSIVQAINRVRCRRVVDAEGNCLPTDVFILLPEDKTGRAILDGIRREMPGIVVRKWQYEAARRKVRRSNFEEALVRYAATLRQGRVAISEVREALSVPKRTMQWLLARLKDGTSDLARNLASRGISYEVVGAGRGARSYLVKA
ncbi:MAG: DEAD/DEAH box helicase family protein [Magnetospirillum sp.]